MQGFALDLFKYIPVIIFVSTVILPVNDETYIEAMPLRGISNKPLFDFWQNKTYGQVLESFWKNWGFLLLEIIKDPERPMSFLFNADDEFINADAIELPR